MMPLGGRTVGAEGGVDQVTQGVDPCGLSFADDDMDQVALLPVELSATVIIRVRPLFSSGSISVDELFIRTLP